MKTKITILLMLVIISLQAQTANDIYLIAQTTEETDISSGVRRVNRPQKSLYIHPPIHFRVKNDNKGFLLEFSHYNYNINELKKTRPTSPRDQMQIIEKPISFLETINPIDLNEMCYEWQTAEEAWEFGDGLKPEVLDPQSKKIYFIDRSDITSSTVKLIEVEFVKYNRPKPSDAFYIDDNGNRID